LRAGKTVDEVRSAQQGKHSVVQKAPAKKIVAPKPVPKPEPEPAVEAEEDQAQDDDTQAQAEVAAATPEQEAAAEQEAEEIYRQLRDAAKAEQDPASASMIQIESEIKIDPNAEEALGFMIGMSPKDYDTKSPEMIAAEKKKAQGPSDAEKAAKEKEEMNQYAQLVAEDASEYSQQLNQEDKDKKEGHDFEGLDEEAMVQLKSVVNN
jgi:hypothetical protein